MLRLVSQRIIAISQRNLHASRPFKRSLHCIRSSNVNSTRIFSRQFHISAFVTQSKHIQDDTSTNNVVGSTIHEENEGEVGEEEVDEDEEDEEADAERDSADNELEHGEVEIQYIGVTYHPERVKKWSSSITVGDVEVDAGEFWTQEDAARGYDELASLYLEDAPLNFDGEHVVEDNGQLSLEEQEWELPEAGKRHADIIAPETG